MKKVSIGVLGLLAILALYNFKGLKKSPADCLELPTEVHSSIERNGKSSHPEGFDSIFTKTDWSELGFPVISEELKLALQHQLHVLDKSELMDERKIANLETSYAEMREVIERLIQRTGTQPNDLYQYLEAYQTWGDDQAGNVYFTGYFTPILKVKQQKSGKYKYPIYAFPKDWKGQLPSRKEIDKDGALETLDLALAYASNPLDVYFMQLQGSGTIEYLGTNERILLRYAGENGHRYRNIQRFFKGREDLKLANLSLDGIRRFLLKHPEKMDSVLHYDPSYTFFEPKKGLAKGSANVPLMPEISIAADDRYFPKGSVVLAAVPVYHNGRVTHHQYKILLPQDRGGAVKGAGHVDVYCGNGQIGQSRASGLHHYGKMWLLLPKRNEQLALK
ncbi:MAG: MltA domain-containing protein [Saprospiraceae bacterium]|nr:MltA domain-containing protein [Saprospiraceae bacterium]